MPSYTSEEIISATKGSCKAVFKANGVVIDSRRVKKGNLFFAIKGEKFDGHDFAAKAIESGAAAVVVGFHLL